MIYTVPEFKAVASVSDILGITLFAYLYIYGVKNFFIIIIY